MSYNPMNPSEAEKHLRKSLLAVITGSSCTYQEAMSAIGYEIGLRRAGPRAIKLFEQKTQELEVRWVTDTVDSATGNSSVSSNKDIVKGRPKTLEGGTIENNAAQDGNLILEVLYLKHIQDGVTMYEIDKLNNVFIVNGTDYAQQIRDAI